MNRAVVVGVLVLVAVSGSIAVGTPHHDDARHHWSETYGPEERASAFHDVVAVDRSTSIAVGMIETEAGDFDGYVVQINPTGWGWWQTTLGDSGDDILYEATPQFAGPPDNVIAVGTRDADVSEASGRSWAVYVGTDYKESTVRWNRTYGPGVLRGVGGRNRWMAAGGNRTHGRAVLRGTTRARQNVTYRDESFEMARLSHDDVLLAGTTTVDGNPVAWAERRSVRDGQAWSAQFPGGAPTRVEAGTTSDDGYVLAVTRRDGDQGELPVLWFVGENGTTRHVTELQGVEAPVEALDHGPNGTILLAGRTPAGKGTVRWVMPDGTTAGFWTRGRIVTGVTDFGMNDQMIAVGQSEGRRALAATIDGRPPRANASVNRTTGEVGDTEFRFDASASTDDDGIAVYRWDFDGDGTVDRVSDDPRVGHVYARPGNATPLVTVVDTRHVANTSAGLSVSLDDSQPPAPALAEPANGLVAPAGPSTLNASTTTDNHRVAEFRWDFTGDGVVDATTESPTATYHFTGPNESHDISLTAVDPSGNANTTTFTVRSVENDRPSVDPEAGIAVANDRTRLRASVTNRVGTSTVAWEFPNGTRKTGRTVTHVFDTTGEQNVTVSVTDEYGARNQRTLSVDVRESYPADHVGPGVGFLALLVVVVPLLVVGGGLILVAVGVLLYRQ